MNIQDIDTPAILIDLDVLDCNLHRIADYSSAHRLCFALIQKHTRFPI